jgi:hypothetical protein
MTSIQTVEQLELPGRANREDGLERFASCLTKLGHDIGMKVSSRGWAYQLEQLRLINKDQFDRVEGLINECRFKGLLPVDFVAEEESRQFSGVEIPEDETPEEWLQSYLETARHCEELYTPNWWEGEEYYIQMVVEKIDLKTLFEPVCKLYHIPIATSRGWSSILQRAAYARRFGEAEDEGLKCVLLYYGDFDPDGVRISDTLRKNLSDIMTVEWSDGTEGYDPSDLIIDRFGLDYDFIMKNNLTWIDNLITGGKRDLGDSSHPNYNLPYVQEWIAKYGKRKCEANAVITSRTEVTTYCARTIMKYLGHDAPERFKEKRDRIRRHLEDFRERTGLNDAIEHAIETIESTEVNISD